MEAKKILEAIRKKCQTAGVTISKLEKTVGIANGTIRHWDNSSPTVSNLQKVADFFGCTVDELLKEE